jgi:hypothetical protein
MSPSHGNGNQQQTLVYQNSPQLTPYSVGISPQNFSKTAANGFRIRPQQALSGHKSNNHNSDYLAFYDNKMLKPLQKEKSLLQKLYRESLQISPQKVPKIQTTASQ